jgi:hypothetical protein
LIATVFCKNTDPQNKVIVDHINTIKKCNFDNNLRWVTDKESAEITFGKKINKVDPTTHQIIATYASIREAARNLYPFKKNVNRISDNISHAAKNEVKYCDFEWKFADVKHCVRHLLVSIITMNEREFTKVLNIIESYYIQ